MQPDQRVIRIDRGDRVKAVREAVGDDQGAFATRLNAMAEQLGMATRFDQARLSKIENGRQDVSLDDAILMAALDPEKRGVEWIATGRASKAHNGRERLDDLKRRTAAKKRRSGTDD